MYKKLLFRGLLIAGIMANIAVMIVISGSKNKPEPVSKYVDYKSKEFKFSIVYPEGWKAEKFIEGQIEPEILFRKTHGTSVTVSMSPAKSLVEDMVMSGLAAYNDNPLDLEHKRRIRTIKSIYKDCECQQAEQVRLGGVGAYRTNFSFFGNESLINHPCKGSIITTEFFGMNYTILMLCRADEYDWMSMILGKMADNFKFEGFQIIKPVVTSAGAEPPKALEFEQPKKERYREYDERYMDDDF